MSLEPLVAFSSILVNQLWPKKHKFCKNSKVQQEKWRTGYLKTKKHIQIRKSGFNYWWVGYAKIFHKTPPGVKGLCYLNIGYYPGNSWSENKTGLLFSNNRWPQFCLLIIGRVGNHENQEIFFRGQDLTEGVQNVSYIAGLFMFIFINYGRQKLKQLNCLHCFCSTFTHWA